MAARNTVHTVVGGQTYSLEQFGLLDGVEHTFHHDGVNPLPAVINRNRFTLFELDGVQFASIDVNLNEPTVITRLPDRCLVRRPGAGTGGGGSTDATARALARISTMEAGEPVPAGYTLWALGKHWTNPTAGAINAPGALTEANILAAGFTEQVAASGGGGNLYAGTAAQRDALFVAGLTANQEVIVEGVGRYLILQDYAGTYAAAVEGTHYEFIAVSTSAPPVYAANKAAFPAVTSDTEMIFHEGNGLTYIKNKARDAWVPMTLLATLAALPQGTLGHEPEPNMICINSSGETYIYEGTGTDDNWVRLYEAVPGNSPAVITAPATLSVDQDDAQVVNITLADADDGEAGLTLTATSSNQALITDASLVISGTGASRTVSVQPVAGQSGTAIITIAVSDGTTTTNHVMTVTIAATAGGTGPVIAADASLVIAQDTASIFPLTLTDADTALGALTVAAASNNQALITDASLLASGSDGNRTLEIQPVAGQAGVADLTISVSDGTSTTDHVLHLAVKNRSLLQIATHPAQTVDNTSFTFDAVHQVHGIEGDGPAPTVLLNGVDQGVMSAVTLQWPGTSTNSVSVFRHTVTLPANQRSVIAVQSGAKLHAIDVNHKDALVIETATTPADLTAKIEAQMFKDSPTDIIEIDFDGDIAAAINAVDASGITRDRWLRIREAAGRTTTWSLDTTATTATVRPTANYLNLEGMTLGSDTDDNAAGSINVNAGMHMRFSGGLTVRGKYKSTWDKDTKLTAAINSTSFYRSLKTEGQQIYMDNVVFDGVAYSVVAAETVSSTNLRFNSVRGDYSLSNDLFLNGFAEDARSIRNFPDTDYLHNDGVQYFTDLSHEVFKGLRIESPNVPSDIQPFLFDRNPLPAAYTDIWLSDLEIVGHEPGGVAGAQLAGVMTDVTIARVFSPDTTLRARRDFPGGTEIPLTPTNVSVLNVDFYDVNDVHPTEGAVYNSLVVADPNDASPELNASNIGITFANVKVRTVPVSMSTFTGGNPSYRTDINTGIFAHDLGANGAGMSTLTIYNPTNLSGVLMGFDSAANATAFLALTGLTFRLQVTVVNQGSGGPPGTVYTYDWDQDSLVNFTSAGARAREEDLLGTSDAWLGVGDNLWGDSPLYTVTHF